ncbi:unnamed protein product [Periconia digitata]|uniref:RBR-type E3 ubiquitin transferase n=1 Tax=Periconia digitata TaxID=1303443 RepID=A0A9W4UE58_9PLEO|nr:unnamed protein product [Periconia digitata]
MGSGISKVLRWQHHVPAADVSPDTATKLGKSIQTQLPCEQHDTSTSESSTSAFDTLPHTNLMDAAHPPQGSTGLPADSGLDEAANVSVHLPDSTPATDSVDSHAAALLDAMRELPSDRDIFTQDKVEKVEPKKTCLICCTTMEKDQEAIEACTCGNYFCISCLKDMFLHACKDISRMPPRCCNIIPIHYVRPHLSEDEIALFRLKFEERNTKQPFYCPVERCSAFISNRLLPEPKLDKGKQRVDSAIGTPKSSLVSCPQCEAGICIDCRNLAHPGVPCEPFKFGLDKKTADLLQRWGYKRCPMCGEGVKRMFGCSHMACRCGAHFCWHCLGPPDDCGDEDDYSDEEQDSDVESSSVVGPIEEDEGKSEEAQTASSRNLDGGGPAHWESSDLDFGEEPQNGRGAVVMCYHRFYTHRVTLKESLAGTYLTATNTMECMSCWREIYPEASPGGLGLDCHITKQTMMIPAGPPSLPADSERAREWSRNRAREHYENTRAHSSLKRELSGYASSVPDLNSPMVGQPPISYLHRPNRRWFHESSSERVIDTYGNLITTQEHPRKRRRYSLDSLTDAPPLDAHLQENGTEKPGKRDQRMTKLKGEGVHSSAVDKTSQSFSLAYRCSECTFIVCSTCKDEMEKMNEGMSEEFEAEIATRNHFGLENEMDEAPAANESTLGDAGEDANLQASAEGSVGDAKPGVAPMGNLQGYVAVNMEEAAFRQILLD